MKWKEKVTLPRDREMFYSLMMAVIQVLMLRNRNRNIEMQSAIKKDTLLRDRQASHPFCSQTQTREKDRFMFDMSSRKSEKGSACYMYVHRVSINVWSSK